MLTITLCPLVPPRPFSQGFPGTQQGLAALTAAILLARLQARIGWLKQAWWALEALHGRRAPGWAVTQCSETPQWEPPQSRVRPCIISPACGHWARTCLRTDHLEGAVLLGLGIMFFSSQINNPVVVLMFLSLNIGGLGVDEPKCG